MSRLTRAEQAQIEQFLADAIADYPVPEEHYAYVSTLMTHVQADFSQALDYWCAAEPTEAQPLSHGTILADIIDLQAEIAHLKAELKKAGKAYGRASEAIGHLRRDLALARLYRVCWARAKASDCPTCRRVFADTHWTLQPEEIAALKARRAERAGCGHLPTAGITVKSPSASERMRLDAAAFGDDAQADAVLAEERAAAEIRAFYGGKPAPLPDGVAPFEGGGLMPGYSFGVEWSAEDGEYVATVEQFPSLSWIEPDPVDALRGLISVALPGDICESCGVRPCLGCGEGED